MVIPDVENHKPIIPTDFVEKADKIIAELDTTVFKLDDEEVYKYIPTKNGDIIREKRAVTKNEVKPSLTPTMVGCRLNRLFLGFAPIDDPESVTPQQYMSACVEFMRVMEHINDFVIMNSNKQLYCLFTGITVDDFNTLMGRQLYASTFRRITDAFSGLDFAGAESGLIDGKTTIAKMQAKDMGFSMQKAEEAPVFITNNTIDKAVISADIERYMRLIDDGKKKSSKGGDKLLTSKK